MGELEMRRAARDMWVSRGHLKAALVGAFLLSGVSFGTGYVFGSGTAEAPRPAMAGFTDQVPGEDLVALLARVESNRSPQGGVETLTFPDALAGSDPAVGPLDVSAEALGAPVEYVADASADVMVDAPPVGAYTLTVATMSELDAAEQFIAQLSPVEGLTPWVGAEIVGGEIRYVVSLGGFASRDAAEAALSELAGLPDFEAASVASLTEADR